MRHTLTDYIASPLKGEPMKKKNHDVYGISRAMDYWAILMYLKLVLDA
ncbi:MAG: hypothetical protein QXM43_07130 [Desulfurococcaceae archaeon]